MHTVTLREAREQRGWDQKALSRLSGVDQSTISRLESGATLNPSHETVKKLEGALGLAPGRLTFAPLVQP